MLVLIGIKRVSWLVYHTCMGHVHYSMQWFTLQSSSSPVSISKALCTPGRSARGTSRNCPMRAGPWWAEVTLRGAPLTGDPGEEPRRPASAEDSLSRGHLVTGSSVSKRLCPCLPGTGVWSHCTLILTNYSSWNWYNRADFKQAYSRKGSVHCAAKRKKDPTYSSMNVKCKCLYHRFAVSLIHCFLVFCISPLKLFEQH